MKPGSGGGPVQNAKAQSAVKQAYGKAGAKASGKHPPKKAGVSGDKGKSNKAPPFGKKK